MCGITGYVGNGLCRAFVLDGLSRMEYRGYDSAGFVCVDSKHGHLSYLKAKGHLSELRSKMANWDHDGSVGMGQIRWATHGVVDDVNAHPHFDCTKTIAVVHNGIIESHAEIRKELVSKGHEFASSTDTEVVAHLFEQVFSQDPQISLKDSLVKLISRLHGAYALTFLLEKFPDTLVFIRHKSPLVLGMGQNEIFVASDPIVFSDKTDRVVLIPDSSFGILSNGLAQIYDFSGNPLEIKEQKIDAKFAQINKQGFEHFMLKEIYEQKRAIDRTVSQNVNSEALFWDQFGVSQAQIKNLKKIHLIGAGTSWHAGRIAQFFFETVAKIPTRVHLASEFRYMPFFPDEDSLYLMISQSGETADTLEALRLINSANLPTVALTNVASSTMVQEAGGFLLLAAGPEISVCSTKAFTCQLTSLYWLAHKIAFERGLISKNDFDAAQEDLMLAAEILESSIENYKELISENLAKKYCKFDRFIFLGRQISYPFALEAALKLKEVSYIFAQCYPSGELKHGPLALIDDKTPVILFSVNDDLIYSKIVSNAQEVKARNGHLISFAFEGQDELIKLSDFAFIIPKVKPLLGPIAMAGLMQFFVYRVAKELGLPIDKPRNLAKSVTVE